ncbi:HAMP domain-containing protein [Microcoleus sp. LEGE 07076]|uniref:sensor histidine kinase n=1 Tax=Microcoleus sp. LEGE 07076 TaxID=915322 RepID=UPI001880F543|nr:ATP-binding protein [Microcoleus sp. LEGE 07076]MBE9185827.1 HAMP domain-containing protein [Microcoleus sp. LEGE 07076]
MLLFTHAKPQDSKVEQNRSDKKNLLQNSTINLTWLKGRFNHLRIGQKISYGYALAIGIAILGTGAGLKAGDYFRKQALVQVNVAVQRQQLLQNLQNTVSEARSHAARLPVVLGDTVWLQYEYNRFVQQINQAKSLISEIQLFAGKHPDALATEEAELHSILNRYAIVIDYYAETIKLQLKEAEIWNFPGNKIEAAQLQMLRNSSGEEAILLDNLAQSLTELISTVEIHKQQGTEAFEQAEGLRNRIIIGSMLISALIAVLLADKTRRAIAQPLETVTNVAQQVARESNFNLQVPVTTDDEIGVLAASFNQLIQRVSEYTQELKQTQSQLIQTEKMSSLGQMVAGIAHEINNPVNFIGGNIDYANQYIEDLAGLLTLYQEYYPNPPDAILKRIEDIELEFLREDLPKTLSSMKMGTDRIREIVVSMRNFSRSDDGKMKPADIHEGIDSTLVILNHRLKQGIQVIKQYGNLPAVECYRAQLNQVFMNVISNAIDALEEVKKADKGYSPTIWISTEITAENTVTVKIRDNGAGIADASTQQIFDPFFTTKSIGKGTGLGLAISDQILAKHHGKIEVNSEIGQGTEFVIALPVAA